MAKRSSVHLQPQQTAASETQPPETELREQMAVALDARAQLDALSASLKDCQRCQLAAKRTHVVFGEGNPNARLMFVGEGPGENEDRQARPFVGVAGQLLDKMIEAMGLSRADVYIANVVKCRPPGNRNPEPAEIDACGGFLQKQIEWVKPEVIVALGKFAAQTLLKTDRPISRLRGSFHAFGNTPLMPTFHPAYLLRNPESKKEAWDDLKKVAAQLQIQIPNAKTSAAKPS